MCINWYLNTYLHADKFITETRKMSSISNEFQDVHLLMLESFHTHHSVFSNVSIVGVTNKKSLTVHRKVDGLHKDVTDCNANFQSMIIHIHTYN